MNTSPPGTLGHRGCRTAPAWWASWWNGHSATRLSISVRPPCGPVPARGGPAGARWRAAGEPAAAVPVQHQPPRALGHDPQRPPDTDRHPRPLPQRLQRPLTRELLHQVLRQPRPPVQPAALGIQVDVDPERVPPAGRLHRLRASGGTPRPARPPTSPPAHPPRTARPGPRPPPPAPARRHRPAPRTAARTGPAAGAHRQLRRRARPAHVIQRRLHPAADARRRRPDRRRLGRTGLRTGVGHRLRIRVGTGRRVERVARQHPSQLRHARRHRQLGHRRLHVRRAHAGPPPRPGPPTTRPASNAPSPPAAPPPDVPSAPPAAPDPATARPAAPASAPATGSPAPAHASDSNASADQRHQPRRQLVQPPTHHRQLGLQLIPTGPHHAPNRTPVRTPGKSHPHPKTARPQHDSRRTTRHGNDLHRRRQSLSWNSG